MYDVWSIDLGSCSVCVTTNWFIQKPSDLNDIFDLYKNFIYMWWLKNVNVKKKKTKKGFPLLSCLQVLLLCCSFHDIYSKWLDDHSLSHMLITECSSFLMRLLCSLFCFINIEYYHLKILILLFFGTGEKIYE